jgi:hypothetical protein
MGDRKVASSSSSSSHTLLDVPIRWRRPDDRSPPGEVFILCSRDNFKAKTRLLPLTGIFHPSTYSQSLSNPP